MTLIFAVMAFFYKYVDLNSPVPYNEESKALIGSQDKISNVVHDSEI